MIITIQGLNDSPGLMEISGKDADSVGICEGDMLDIQVLFHCSVAAAGM
jgi:hypothetical protein